MTEQYKSIPATDRVKHYATAVWDFDTDGGEGEFIHPLITSVLPVGAVIRTLFTEGLIKSVGSSSIKIWGGGNVLTSPIVLSTGVLDKDVITNHIIQTESVKGSWDPSVDRSIYIENYGGSLTAGKLAITISYFPPVEQEEA